MKVISVIGRHKYTRLYVNEGGSSNYKADRRAQASAQDARAGQIH